MFKILVLSAFLFSGCSYFTISMAMCQQIASDPNSAMPEQCRNYIEEEAVKAYFNNKSTISVDDKDLEVHKEEK